MELNFKKEKKMKNKDIETKEKNNCIRVCIRVRPLLEHEDVEFWQVDKDKNIIYTDNYYSDQNEIINESYALTNNLSNKSLSYAKKDVKKLLIDSIYTPQKFNFDRVYSIDCDSQLIYKEMCKDVVSSALQGYNGSIFMYGQTTSGKTFTMLGSPSNPGVLPCVLRDIFLKMKKIKKDNNKIEFKVYCSYIEIYNENIHDLLTDSNYLKLIDDKKYGVVVAGAKKVKIDDFETGIAIKNFGEENRKYRETLFNEYSSRSHCIFQIFIESFEIKDEGENVINKFSCLNLIDLAGSERINEYESKNITTGETGYINKSLFVLAHVINKLAENNTGKKIHIPYRDSKLTRLLSQALGGNSLTTIICTVSPAALNYYQTLSTLRFAMRARSVKLKLNSNEYVDDKEKIEFYKNEIKKLKEELRNRNLQDISIRSEGYGNNNILHGGKGFIRDDLKEIMNSYKNMNDELNNYKELYLKEKQKTENYREHFDNLKNKKESNNINNINTDNDVTFIDEILTQINLNDESNNQINSLNYNKWKEESQKFIQNYKNDLASLKEAYIKKIKILHDKMFSNNNNNDDDNDIINIDKNGINLDLKNNTEDNNNINTDKINNMNIINTESMKDKEDKEDKEENNLLNNNNINSKNDSLLNSAEINLKTKLPDELLRISQNHSKILPNLSETNTIEDLNEEDEVISKINSGDIFSGINLEYETSDNEDINKIENFKKLYSDKIDELEKAMEHWKSYIETFYRNKIKKINEGGGVEMVGLIDGELPVMKYTTQHQNTLKKLRDLYESKVKELEKSFFNILKIITAKKVAAMNNK